MSCKTYFETLKILLSFSLGSVLATFLEVGEQDATVPELEGGLAGARGTCKEMQNENKSWLESQNFMPQVSLILDEIPLIPFTTLLNASSPQRAS